ncbi:MAG: cobyric acid synthase CobQ [Archaeoglobaceae archaeon]|nr:cobyric acid synthase CobQ [Archaeoglobaceae archaeon]MCX8152116.1 cobyric acid synthase CobQ [Archaeoglobaceae archaeon]MDW8013552.1 cobyric acid synthase CobQ [Archaeoglobaceae archaeon]
MVAGTSSSAGKSTIVAAICRILAKRGYEVAPFKAQNMSLNSFVTKNGKEIAFAQAYQAFAAGIEPDERMNPILLKPKGNFVSQLVVMGEVVGDVSYIDYLKLEWLKDVVMRAYEELASEFEIIVIEGAGGFAEINLFERDIPNIFVARFAKPKIVIVGDIDRGGVFASLYGTYMLLPSDVRELVKGFIINKLRGRKELLDDGIRKIEEICGVKVLGVLPYLEINLPSEDSLNLEEWKGNGPVKILKLPRMSNYTDFESVRNVCHFSKDLSGDFEVLIVPGSKDTVADLAYLKTLEDEIRAIAGKKPIIGICGGYQMLGKEIIDHGVEHGFLRVKGLGLLDAFTEFRSYKKITKQVVKKVTGDAVILEEIRGQKVWGYEIHKGITKASRPVLEDDGCVSDDGMVWGTYLHGIFWNKNLIEALGNYLGLKIEFREDWAERLAEEFEKNINLSFLFEY